jgi:chitin disaccharide deacetylase
MTNRQPTNSGGRARRLLIVNADDFGRTHTINRGIVRAHVEGIVTSASLMVRWRAAEAAAIASRACPALSVGLHVDLGEWVYRAGAWHTVYEVVPSVDARQVATEVARQLDAFRQLVDRDPTHLDSHQHVHRSEPVRSVLRDVAHRLNAPLRGDSDLVTHCGSFYGQTGSGEPLADAISVTGLSAILAALPIGVSELGCHPSDAGEHWSTYSHEREVERRTLCDPDIIGTIGREAIELVNFNDLVEQGDSHGNHIRALSRGSV